MIHNAGSVAADLLDELGPIIADERAAFAHRCHTRSISMTHLLLMTLLETHGPLPMSRVAELLGCGLPTATGIVSRMEEHGLVERQHDTEDRRVVTLRLSKEGANEISELQLSRRERMATALAHLSDPERDQLLTSVRALRAAFNRVNSQGDNA
ncbi:MAG: MarR family winged helix-turn-helix transcriptional regulator [Candidatus Limnocylindria bacterium]